jgi:hypothetical protein
MLTASECLSEASTHQDHRVLPTHDCKDADSDAAYVISLSRSVEVSKCPIDLAPEEVLVCHEGNCSYSDRRIMQ